MNGITSVKSVGYEEEKSLIQVEEELIQQHEEKIAASQDTQEEVIKEEEKVEERPILELDDDKVLSYFREKHGKEVNSLDELFTPKKEELPEDVEAFLKYKRETGRGLSDFYMLNQDYDKVPESKLLSEFIKENNPEFDEEDIAFELEKFSYDEDLDDEKDIKARKIALKKELTKAKEYFESKKEQYKAPLELREPLVPQEDREDFEAFKQSRNLAQQQQEEAAKRSSYFAEKTNELFSEKFEGFKFELGETEAVYKPGDANELKERQSNLQNFIGKFINDEGFLKDAEAFHKAIAVASDVEKFAKFFYEKGKADQTVSFEKESKNIDMRTGATPAPTGGPSIRAVESDSTNSKLVIKSRNR